MCSAAGGSTQGYGSDKQTSFAGTMSQGMGGAAGGSATILGAAPALAANGTVLASYTPPRQYSYNWGNALAGKNFGPYTYPDAQRQKF